MEKLILKTIRNYSQLKLLDYRQGKHHIFRVGVGDKVFVITVACTKHHSYHLLRTVEGDFRRALRNCGFEELGKTFRLLSRG